ncbi:hypothetical protein R1sor_017421 [Riccia sorocarpa]|uniref:Uncharacterized protein n=1 Tax=Riccia sorocarpa TaxID=122646 RepID=A0ABD3I8K8_9MARC
MEAAPTRIEYKERVSQLLSTWCADKGIDAFYDKLVCLLDEDYLHSFRGIRKIPFPKESKQPGDTQEVDVDVAPLYGRVPPPSLREKSKWKASAASRCSIPHKQYDLDFSTLPVLRSKGANTGRGLDPRYVTRSLFQDKGGKNAAGAADHAADSPTVINGYTLAGCVKDAFPSGKLPGNCNCDLEYVCCWITDEFSDDVLGLQMVKVRCLQSVEELVTFRSNLIVPFEASKCVESCKDVCSPVVITPEPTIPVPGSVLTAVFESDSDSEWTKHDGEFSTCSSDMHDSDSDWLDVADEICEEDLPRLGVLQLDADFRSDPVEWQLADEHWPQHTSKYSHSTEFKGPVPVPLPDWFSSGERRLRPIDFLIAFASIHCWRLYARRLTVMLCRKGKKMESFVPIGASSMDRRSHLHHSIPQTRAAISLGQFP